MRGSRIFGADQCCCDEHIYRTCDNKNKPRLNSKEWIVTLQNAIMTKHADEFK